MSEIVCPIISCMQVGLDDHGRTVLCLRSPSNISIEPSDFIIISRFADEVATLLEDLCVADYIEDTNVFYVGKICDFCDMAYLKHFMKALGCSSPEQYVVGYVFSDQLSGLIGLNNGNVLYNISPIAITVVSGKTLVPLEYIDVKLNRLACKQVEDLISKIY